MTNLKSKIENLKSEDPAQCAGAGGQSDSMKTGMRHEATGNSKGAKILGFALCLALLALCDLAHAQPNNIPRIGFLAALSASSQAPRLGAFRKGLDDLGYYPGKSITLETRFAEGDDRRLKLFAAEMVRRRMDIIVSAGSTPTRVVQNTTSTIPIVMAQDSDPVGNGFVGSLAKPGGNITGLSTLAPEISGKQLELLKEIVPRLSRVAVVESPTTPGTSQKLKEIERAAQVLGATIQLLDVLAPKDIETAFQVAHKERAEGVLILASPINLSQCAKIVTLATRNRIPTIYPEPEYMDAGGLMLYAVNVTDLFGRAATYVDKILKGAKPADLPVERPTKFEFIINLKAAKQIGLTIPPNVLARADRVIK